MSFDIKNSIWYYNWYFNNAVYWSILSSIQTACIEFYNNDKEEQNIQISLIEEIINNFYNEIIQISVELIKDLLLRMTLIKNWQNYIQNMI